MSVEQSLVLTEVNAGVARLTLNRPQQYNALSSAMLGALHAALDSVAANRAVRVIIIAAEGKAFCAGHDLREIREHDDEAWHRALFDRCSALMLRLQEISQPVIAEVHGIATAAGCQLVAACDLAVASADARFATSGIGLGLFCSTPAVALRANLSAKHAAHLLYTGQFIDAQHAERVGLVSQVVAADQLRDQTQRLAAQIAAHSSAALESGKRLLQSFDRVTTSDHYATASANMAADLQTNDAKLGIDAFLQKAPTPLWTHQ